MFCNVTPDVGFSKNNCNFSFLWNSWLSITSSQWVVFTRSRYKWFLYQKMFRKEICIKKACINVYILSPSAKFVVMKVHCPCYWIKLLLATYCLFRTVVKLETSLLRYIIKLEKFRWKQFATIKNQASSWANFRKVKTFRNIINSNLSYQFVSNWF